MAPSDPRQIRNMLDGLIGQLEAITKRDPEQELQGIALGPLDAAITAAKEIIGPDNPVAASAADVISPDTVERGEPIRAVDALVLAQLLRDSITVPPIRIEQRDPYFRRGTEI